MKKHLFLLVAVTLLMACVNKTVNTNLDGKQNLKLTEQWTDFFDVEACGQPPAIDINKNQNIVVFQRAGKNSRLSDGGFIQENVLFEIDHLSGKAILGWGANMFKKPHGLSIDNKGNIWVTDLVLHQVFKFNGSGQLLLTLGEKETAGNDGSHFNQPTDAIASPDGYIYVTDGYGNNRVAKFDSEGKFVKDWGIAGNGNGEFNLPHSVDIDHDGNIYVSDRENNRVQKFNPDGTWIKTWADPSFASIQSLKISGDGKTLFATDYRLTDDGKPKGSDILKINTADSKFIRLVHSEDLGPTPSRYHDIALDSTGNIYVADIIKNKVLKFTKK